MLYRVIKRIFDLLGTILLLLVLSPLFFMVAVLIKLTTPGEVVFKQLRIGRHGELFYLYKFRSMVKGAQEMGSGMFVEENDERITLIGKILRKTSLDELPQLFNVLKGEMSLVGPRPAPVHHLTKYNEEQRRRLAVKPGITGWAQVNGRVALYWPQRIELDLWYIDHYSLWLDVKILFLTLIAVLTRRGEEAKPDRKYVDPFMKID
ncbi:MAG: sugar transferase [Peptococcaceae bacterium]|jgi:exopolysaccharide biosynthesis polyprenyl glycosylphosphotransferase|nr:MAG: sugar transferase [Peptococcaceae bacterium]